MLPLYSQASVTRKSSLPTLTLPFISSKIPPRRIVGFSFECNKIFEIILVVVDLPWEPEIAIEFL